jgi:integrase
MSRRGNKEGSIYQRNDGRWVSVIDLGYRNGKRHRKSIYGETRKEVGEKLTRELRSQQLGIPASSERITVKDWLMSWLRLQEPPARKPKAYTAYENHVRLHLVPALGNIRLAKLQPQDVREFMRVKAAEGLASKSIAHYRTTLSTALNMAVHDGVIARNVAALAKPPRVEKPELRVLSKDEALRFIGVAKGHRLEAMFTVALSLGMREGEILGLPWQDVDFDAGTLQVVHALQRVKRPGEKKSKLELLAPKTDRCRRTIALPQVAISALLAHRGRQEQERAAYGTDWRESGMVFTSSTGTMLDQRNMLRSFYAIMNTPDPTDLEADPEKRRKLLPRVRFHDLRHSAATLLLVQGVHPRFVMDLLGHSFIAVTMNIYSHVLDPMKQEIARQTDEVFKPVAVNLAVKPASGKAN